MTTTDFDALAHPDKLNIGCGWDKREGYLNIDFLDYHEPDLVADIRDLSILPTGHYSEIVAQDVLEHLERDEVDPALAEWARLLSVGGRLIVRVPDVMGVARQLAKERTVEHHKRMIHALLGTQAYNGDYHHATFTELTLRHSLHEAGFEVTDLRPRDEWMFDVVATKVDDPGVFDPGPMPFLELCEPTLHADPPVTVAAEDPTASSVGRIDQAVQGVAERLPESARAAGRRVWRPLRSRISGIIDRIG